MKIRYREMDLRTCIYLEGVRAKLQLYKLKTLEFLETAELESETDTETKNQYQEGTKLSAVLSAKHNGILYEIVVPSSKEILTLENMVIPQ